LRSEGVKNLAEGCSITRIFAINAKKNHAVFKNLLKLNPPEYIRDLRQKFSWKEQEPTLSFLNSSLDEAMKKTVPNKET
ncbi:MAG: hypothetical protein KDK55_06080, partial [Chlamydiia bacterium]|nr:hypothetical protein [Chlamydiia bacterium]